MTTKTAFIRAWLDDIDRRLAAMASLKAQRTKAIIFTLSTTSKADPQGRPYLTPLRETLTEFISGVIVRSLDQAALVALALRGRVDLVFVDAEEKRGLDVWVDQSLWSALGMSVPLPLLADPIPRMVQVCQALLDPAVMGCFKPNDLTVESVWHFLDLKLDRPTHIGILGAGNIGFKLALKLVEAGHTVALNRRDQVSAQTLVAAIEAVKPPLSSGRAYAQPDAMAVARDCQVLIGVSDGVPVITEAMVDQLDPRGLIIDVGKGTVSPEGIQRALARRLDISRTDITSGLQGFLASHHRQVEILQHEMGRRVVEPGLALVSGGFLGDLNDVIVDHFAAPQRIVGLADGRGDLIRELQPEHVERLARVEAYIQRLNPAGEVR
jgi:NAD(P)-dependent dehydrogenase (short-subunit alcohol dehydrogenase family)